MAGQKRSPWTWKPLTCEDPAGNFGPLLGLFVECIVRTFEINYGTRKKTLLKTHKDRAEQGVLTGKRAKGKFLIYPC